MNWLQHQFDRLTVINFICYLLLLNGSAERDPRSSITNLMTHLRNLAPWLPWLVPKKVGNKKRVKLKENCWSFRDSQLSKHVSTLKSSASHSQRPNAVSQCEP